MVIFRILITSEHMYCLEFLKIDLTKEITLLPPITGLQNLMFMKKYRILNGKTDGSFHGEELLTHELVPVL